MAGVIGGMSHESMTAMMRAMLILAAPALIVVGAVLVTVIRRWKSEMQEE